MRRMSVFNISSNHDNEEERMDSYSNSISMWLQRIILRIRIFRMELRNPLWKRRIEILVLMLISILSFMLRIFSVIKYEAIIHEFDPYFNYKLTKILNEKGFYYFWNYFDDRSWYPLGRITGPTLYPGLMLLTVLIYKFLHLLGFLVNIQILCLYIEPIFSILTCIMSYFLCKQIHPYNGVALLSAFFVSICPSHLSRSMIGAYDNEAISIFLLLLSLYSWIHCLKEGSLSSALFCTFSTYGMILSWGAYTFILNVYSLFILIAIVFKKYTIKHCIMYNVCYVMITLLCLNTPCISHSVFRSMEHFLSHMVYILCGVLTISHFFIHYLKLDETLFKKNVMKALFVSVFLIIQYVLLTKVILWSDRTKALFNPFYMSEGNPIVASISEHQPTSWNTYMLDFHILLFFYPLGIYISFQKNARFELFCFAVCSVVCLYLSSLMIRLLLILFPFLCILSSIGLSFLLNQLFSQWKGDSIMTSTTIHGYDSLNTLTKEKIQKEEFIGASLSNEIHVQNEMNERTHCIMYIILCIFLTCILILLLVLLMIHSTWCASFAYSETNIIFNRTTMHGNFYIDDDVRQMYEWINRHTQEDSRILAWWDYGYQLSVMSDRITYVDNNTWNPSHISTIGQFLSSNEERIKSLIEELNVDYVLISYGGYSKNSSDDLNKYAWILKVAKMLDPSVNPLLFYYHDKNQHPLGKNATFSMRNSILYKLSYHNITNKNIQGYDSVRNIEVPPIHNLSEVFQEVFTTDFFGFRLYKIKKNLQSEQHI